MCVGGLPPKTIAASSEGFLLTGGVDRRSCRKPSENFGEVLCCQVKEEGVGHGGAETQRGISVSVMRLGRQMDERELSRAPPSSN